MILTETKISPRMLHLAVINYLAKDVFPFTARSKILGKISVPLKITKADTELGIRCVTDTTPLTTSAM
jgi:hypothetical protein